MEFMAQGGIMMWPLLLLSVVSFAIIIERVLFYSAISKKEIGFDSEGSEKQDLYTQFPEMIKQSAFFSNPLMGEYKNLLLENKGLAEKEVRLLNEGQKILVKCSRGFDLLSTIVKCAPLMGLLGTVIGMIETFSRLETNQSGVDISLLAGGIWQALITTATGLVIALISLFAYQYFVGLKKDIIDKLESCARISLLDNK